MYISLVKQTQLYFIFSFALLIVGGMLLLKLPFCYREAAGVLRWSDALFTSTSAVCVTGLSSVLTSNFTLTGQMVILMLIQIGGIGIMTLTAAIVLWLGRGMSFGNTMMMSNLSDNFSMRHTEGLLKTVITYTLSIEAVGAAVLIVGFVLAGKYTPAEAVYYGVFHSISAFCNAGFSPFDESLIGATALIKITVAVLIVLGGIGIYVIYDLSHFRSNQAVLKIHTRLVLITTAILIVLGGGGLMLLEYYGAGKNIGALDAFFMSISARTAGFNAIDPAKLDPCSNALLIVLMMIGASPGSTGGGIKTTVIALATLAIINTFMGNDRVLIFRREIQIGNILKSFSIIVTFILLVTLGSTILAVMIPGNLQAAIFETASALSTVGLSIGATAQLTLPGKILIILYMFIGRIGPFTMFLFLLGRERVNRINYPEERIIIG